MPSRTASACSLSTSPAGGGDTGPMTRAAWVILEACSMASMRLPGLVEVAPQVRAPWRSITTAFDCRRWGRSTRGTSSVVGVV